MTVDTYLQKETRWLLDEKYQGRRTQEAVRDIAKLKKGEHIDYLIGFVQFLGCKIDLSKRPFIPEPETEYWVQKTIKDIKNSRRKNIHVLDVFSGSGCIGIAILVHISQAKVDFAEKYQKFCKQIAINTKLNHIVSSRYNIMQSDIFSNVSGRYDYILANPPYVPERNRKSVQKSVLENEPLTAIFSGTDGLNYIREFLKESKNHLKKGGKIYMEFDSTQKEQIPKLLKEYGYKNSEILRDQYHRWRFLVTRF